MRGQGSAGQQIIDRAEETPETVAAGAFSGGGVDGTIFDLLPNQTLRIFNASMQLFSPDAPGVILVQSMNLYVQFYDGAHNKLNAPAIQLAGENWANPGALLNGAETGMTIATDGDPIIEFVSNFRATGFGADGPQIAAFSISTGWDAQNPGMSDLTVFSNLCALFSFVPRA